MSTEKQPAEVGPVERPLGLEPERAAFEAFVAEWTGRDMRYHESTGTWGLGLDSFAWACWQRAVAAERKRCIAECKATAEDVTDAAKMGALECWRRLA